MKRVVIALSLTMPFSFAQAQTFTLSGSASPSSVSSGGSEALTATVKASGRTASGYTVAVTISRGGTTVTSHSFTNLEFRRRALTEAFSWVVPATAAAGTYNVAMAILNSSGTSEAAATTSFTVTGAASPPPVTIGGGNPTTVASMNGIPGSPCPMPPTTTACLLNVLGVDVHLAYGEPLYASASTVESALAYVGIRRVRDVLLNITGSSSAMAVAKDLAAKGIVFDLTSVSGPTTANLNTVMAAYNAWAAAMPGSLFAVEGPNEIDLQPITYGSLTGLAAGTAFQEAFYTAVKADSALSGVPVLNLTLGNGNPTLYGELGDLSAYCDYGNAHLYPQSVEDYVNPYQSYSVDIPWEVSIDSPSKSTIITETGYYTMPDNAYGVDDDVAAKYMLDMPFDAVLHGVSQMSFYDLFDDTVVATSTDPEAHYGLFDNTGAPKASGTAMHNLITILADPGNATSVVGTAPNYTLSNQPAPGYSLVLGKSTGTFELVVWSEPDIWNQTTDTEISVTPTAMTVNLGQTYPTVNVYDPLQGTSPINTYSNVSSVVIKMADHPIIVELEP